MDYAEDGCALRRTFGEKGSEVWFELRKRGPAEEFLLTVASAALRVPETVPYSRFDPDGPNRRQDLATFVNFGEGVKGLVFTESLLPDPLDEPGEIGAEEKSEADIEAERLLREGAVTGFYLESGFEQTVFLHTGALEKPMNAMRACLDDLLVHWGVDPTVQSTLSKPASGRDQDRWARWIVDRYPKELLWSERSARVGVGLVVNVEGQTESCRILFPLVAPSYEAEICGYLIKKAEFVPAQDVSGTPVKSYYTTSIIYQPTR